MAKLNLNIEADTADEMRGILMILAGHGAYADDNALTPSKVGVMMDALSRPSSDGLNVEQGEAQKRTRRTKAQIEADAAASVGSQLGQTSAEVVSEEHPTQAGPSASQESAAAPDEASLKRQTQAALAAYMAAHDGQRAQEVLKTFQTVDGKPAMSVGQLQPKDYPAAIDALRV